LEIAPEAINCAAPDTANGTLHLFATEEQSNSGLEPLLKGEIAAASP